MATITPAQPIYMYNTVLTVDGDDYAAALTSATLIPTQTTVSARGLKPGARWVRLTDPEWKLDTTAHQDDADDSWKTFLEDNEGATKTFILTPEDGGRTRTVTVIIPAVQTGGALDEWATFPASFEVIGQPIRGELPGA